jgi:hypothetical protein
MLPKSLLLLISALTTSYNGVDGQQVVLEQATPGLTFQLRHVHASLPDSSRSLFADVDPKLSFQDSDQFLQTNNIMLHKPRFLDAPSLNVGHWDLEPVLAPNVSDRATLLELAKMTKNAYFEPDDKEWYDLKGRWKVRLYC